MSSNSHGIAIPPGVVEITWYGHGTWLLRYLDQTVLLDPFLNNNPKAPVKADAVQCNTILVTHGHFDHIDDCVSIAKRCGAKVITNFEIGNWLEKQGVSEPVGMNIGGQFQHAGMTIKMTNAVHSSSLPDGSYGGWPAGFLITVEGKTIYFAGDTAPFGDMQYLSPKIDLAVLPIGDLFTMGPQDSLQAIQWLQPAQVVGGHFDTWPPIQQDGDQWANSVRSQGVSDPIVTAPGQPFRLD